MLTMNWHIIMTLKRSVSLLRWDSLLGHQGRCCPWFVYLMTGQLFFFFFLRNFPLRFPSLWHTYSHLTSLNDLSFSQTAYYGPRACYVHWTVWITVFDFFFFYTDMSITCQLCVIIPPLAVQFLPRQLSFLYCFPHKDMFNLTIWLQQQL